MAELLDLPHVGAVQGFELADDGKHFEARRRIEGAEEVVECDLPVLLTLEKGFVEPRYPSLPNLMKAKKKPVKVLTSADLSADESVKAGTQFVSIAPPPPRPECKFIEGEPEEMAKELARALREEAKVVLAQLQTTSESIGRSKKAVRKKVMQALRGVRPMAEDGTELATVLQNALNVLEVSGFTAARGLHQGFDGRTAGGNG